LVDDAGLIRRHHEHEFSAAPGDHPTDDTITMMPRWILSALLAMCPLFARAGYADHPPADLLVPQGMSSSLFAAYSFDVGGDEVPHMPLKVNVELIRPDLSSGIYKFKSEDMDAFDIRNFSVFGKLLAINLDTGEQKYLDASVTQILSPQKKSFIYNTINIFDNLTNPDGVNIRFQQVSWIVHPIELDFLKAPFPGVRTSYEFHDQIEVPTPAVPEPSGFLLAVCGLAVLLKRLGRLNPMRQVSSGQRLMLPSAFT
jgi:hypothetical protein